MILPRAYGFIFSRVLVFFPFLWARKIQGAALLRARIGGEITYSTACLLVDMAEIAQNCAVNVFH